MSPADTDTILYRLGQQDKKLDEIREHVQKTNGRVTALELWRARAQGAWFVACLAGPVIAALVAKYVG